MATYQCTKVLLFYSTLRLLVYSASTPWRQPHAGLTHFTPKGVRALYPRRSETAFQSGGVGSDPNLHHARGIRTAMHRAVSPAHGHLLCRHCAQVSSSWTSGSCTWRSCRLVCRHSLCHHPSFAIGIVSSCSARSSRLLVLHCVIIILRNGRRGTAVKGEIQPSGTWRGSGPVAGEPCHTAAAADTSGSEATSSCFSRRSGGGVQN